MGALFRRLFLTRLIQLHQAGRLAFFGSAAHLIERRAFLRYLSPVRSKRWVVYAKPPFAGPQAVLAYLSRYTAAWRSRTGGWLGLTTRRYQSGEIDYDGHISRRGDKHLRGLLYEAAVTVLTRSQADSGLREWGLKLRERIGFKRAAVAVARKLAVIMHTMLKSGEIFDPAIGATA